MLNGFGDAAEIEELRRAMAAEFGVTVAVNGANIGNPAQVREPVAEAIRALGKVDVVPASVPTMTF